MQRLLKPEDIVRFDGLGEPDALLHVVGRVHVEHQQGIADGLARGADAHQLLVQRHSAGFELDRTVTGSHKLPQFLGTGSQGRVLDVIAASGVRKDLLAGAAEQPVEGHIGSLALDIPQGDIDTADSGHDLGPLATWQGRWQSILTPHPAWSRGGKRKEPLPHVNMRQGVHAADDLPTLLDETANQRLRTALNLAIAAHTGIGLHLNQN